MPLDETRFDGPRLPSPFRSYPLDGAMLYVEPRSGTHVRVENAATRHLRRRAPRVVMFGITNACNLHCSFCSRDQAAKSLWTVESAFEVLRDLGEAGVLEVAFGGGEPLVFPGFAELVARLAQHTQLGLHVTTNGTRVSPQTWAPLAGHIGMARLSVYDDTDVAQVAAVWNALDQRWGANVLVCDATLPRLPALLQQLAAFGAYDVSVLTYVGEPTRLLSAQGRASLSAILRDAPLPTRLSVCAGEGVEAPRLFEGLDRRDCGAGYDFVTVTSDQRLQACSFAPAPFAAHTAEAILSGWRKQSRALRAASPRVGCARARPALLRRLPQEATGEARAALPPLAVWRSFAGNNSGECVMVARFEHRADAEQFLVTLLPGFVPDAPWCEAWLTLAQEAGVATPARDDAGRTYVDAPREMVQVGHSVIALGYDSDDAFHELRHLAWRKQAAMVGGLVHAHEPLALVALARCRDADAAEQCRRALKDDAAARMRVYLHGADVFVVAPLDGDSALTLQKAALERVLVARAPDAEVVADVVVTPDDEAITHALSRLGNEEPQRLRMQAHFYGADGERDAAQFAVRHSGDAPLTRAGSLVLLDCGERPRRIAIMAARAKAHASFSFGARLAVSGTFWILQAPPRKGTKAPARTLSPTDLNRRLQTTLGSAISVKAERHRQDMARIVGLTEDPAAVMRACEVIARADDLRLHLAFRDEQPLRWTLRRLRAELHHQLREGRT